MVEIDFRLIEAILTAAIWSFIITLFGCNSRGEQCEQQNMGSAILGVRRLSSQIFKKVMVR
jgi:uncharacterized lipoprotein NlpE involved in copper resistance